MTIKEISKVHGRTENSIISRIKKNEISKNEEKIICIIEQYLKNTVQCQVVLVEPKTNDK